MYASLEYIDKNLNGDISLVTLAKKAYLSKYHYHRLFHQVVGEPVSKYISKKRMERAAKDLSETDQPIIDIALNYRYGSPEAFSRAFKRVYNTTPGNYRRMHNCTKKNTIIYLRTDSSPIEALAA
jgi:AraC-like DNA-binding protein